VGAVLVDPRDQQAHPERPLAGVLGLNLGLIAHFGDQPAERVARPIREPIVHALIAHILAQDAPIRSQPRHPHADVLVHLEHFLEVVGQLEW
jgi:hypothetical protein